jgi:hypothetical protein
MPFGDPVQYYLTNTSHIFFAWLLVLIRWQICFAWLLMLTVMADRFMRLLGSCLSVVLVSTAFSVNFVALVSTFSENL